MVLTTEGSVLVALAGEGEDLPENEFVQTVTFGIDPPDRPDSLKLVGGPTRYQTQFILEAVGEDADGSIVPIDDLSYTPEAGWGAELIGQYYNVGAGSDQPSVNRELARKTVFRWYRIRCTPDGEFTIPGYNGTTVEELWQLLPIETHGVGIYTDDDGVERPVPLSLEGQWWDRSHDDKNFDYDRTWGKGYTLDVERGIVMLSQPAALFADDKDNPERGVFAEATLYLTVGHGVKNAETFVEERYISTFQMPGQPSGVGPQILRRDDVIRTSIGKYDADHNLLDDQTVENTKELDKEAEYYFNAKYWHIASESRNGDGRLRRNYRGVPGWGDPTDRVEGGHGHGCNDDDQPQ